MKYRRDQHRVGTCLSVSTSLKCSKLARAARRDDRYAHDIRYGARGRQVVAVFGAVGIHAGQQYLALRRGASASGGPLQQIAAGVHPSAVQIHVPARFVCSQFCVDRAHHALAAEALLPLRLINAPGSSARPN